MTRPFHSLTKDTRGSTFIFVAAGLTAMVLALGFALDMSSYSQAKSQFRNAVDQAALATASASVTSSRDAMKAYASQYIEANFTQNGLNASLSKVNASYNSGRVEWTVTASAKLKPSFTSFLGVKNLPLQHSAKVTWDEVTREVVFAVDMSASMCVTFDTKARASEEGTLKVVVPTGNNVDCTGDKAKTKLKYVRDALRCLIGGANCPSGEDFAGWTGLPLTTTHAGAAAYKVGIVPFNHKVKFPSGKNAPDVLTASEVAAAKNNVPGAAGYFSDFEVDPGAAETEDYPLPAVTPLVGLTSTKNRQTLMNAVDKLTTRYDVPGWTRSNLGLLTAGIMLDPAYYANFGGVQPAAEGTSHNEKIVFLLTDGANMGCCFSDHPTGTYEHQYLYSYRTDNEHMSDPTNGLCTKLKTQGFKVYTMVYDVQDNDAGGSGAVIKKILEDCASGGKDEYYFDIADLNDGERIAKSYKNIAQALMGLRLSK